MKKQSPGQLSYGLGAIVFYALLALIPPIAIPYGTVQPWWKSVFQCAVFALAALWIIPQLFTAKRSSSRVDRRVVWPVLALIVFAFIQTLPSLGFAKPVDRVSQTISADPFQTWQFVIQLAALLSFGLLVAINANSLQRLRWLVETIIGVGTVSALFGVARATFQTSPGFGLPSLVPGYGYAQFINSNHFAFLVEMALGLSLGIAVSGGVKGKRLIVYLIAAVPMWIALIFSNSRGGILSILCQVLFLALLITARRPREEVTRAAYSNPIVRAGRNLILRLVLIACLFAAAITTVVFVGGDPLVGRVDSLSVELNRSVADTYTLRPAIWRATLSLIKDNPIVGVGFGGYWIAISGYHNASGATTPQEAHNDYLELLASGGVIAAAIALWFVFALSKTARDKLKLLNAGSYERAATLGALTGILTVAVHSLVDFGLHITINAVVFTALVAIVAIRPKSNVQSPTSA